MFRNDAECLKMLERSNESDSSDDYLDHKLLNQTKHASNITHVTGD